MLSKIERYQDSGVYVCAVNNGIPDQNGDIIQQGQTSVSVKGLPVFIESNEPFQKGKMDNFAFLTVHIISNPKYDDVFCLTSNWKLSLKNKVQAHYDEINESEQVNISHMLQNQRSTIQEPPSANIIRSFSSNLSSSSSSKSEHVYLDPYNSFIQSENYITLGIMKLQTPYKIRDKISPFFSLTCVAAENKFKCTQKGNRKASRQYRSAEF